MSCDDEVLESVFKYPIIILLIKMTKLIIVINHSPDEIVFPIYYWARLRKDIGIYLREV